MTKFLPVVTSLAMVALFGRESVSVSLVFFFLQGTNSRNSKVDTADTDIRGQLCNYFIVCWLSLRATEQEKKRKKTRHMPTRILCRKK